MRTAAKIEREDCGDRVGGLGRAYGFVDAMPTGGYTGTWTIGGVAYAAVAGTQFDFPAGAGVPKVGSHVPVKCFVDGARGLANTAASSVGGVTFTVTDATITQEGASTV